MHPEWHYRSYFVNGVLVHLSLLPNEDFMDIRFLHNGEVHRCTYVQVLRKAIQKSLRLPVEPDVIPTDLFGEDVSFGVWIEESGVDKFYRLTVERNLNCGKVPLELGLHTLEYGDQRVLSLGNFLTMLHSHFLNDGSNPPTKEVFIFDNPTADLSGQCIHVKAVTRGYTFCHFAREHTLLISPQSKLEETRFVVVDIQRGNRAEATLEELLAKAASHLFGTPVSLFSFVWRREANDYVGRARLVNREGPCGHVLISKPMSRVLEDALILLEEDELTLPISKKPPNIYVRFDDAFRLINYLLSENILFEEAKVR